MLKLFCISLQINLVQSAKIYDTHRHTNLTAIFQVNKDWPAAILILRQRSSLS